MQPERRRNPVKAQQQREIFWHLADLGREQRERLARERLAAALEEAEREPHQAHAAD